MRTILLLLSAVALLALAACARDSAPATDATTDTSPEAAAVDPADDEYSYAEPKKVKTTELALDLAVDFDHKQISGTATYTLDWLDPAADQLVLDTRDLDIEAVEGAGADGQWAPLQFVLADADPLLGSKLTIDSPERNERIRVTYTTSPDASGLDRKSVV